MDIPFDPNLRIIDVRRETEFAEGHVKGAINMPLDEMADIVKFEASFSEHHNLYIHCNTGYRSVIAISLTKQQGIHNLRNVTGGWQKIKEIPVIKIVKDTSVLN
jgi:hydroxyacylglutathione hydrolase